MNPRESNTVKEKKTKEILTPWKKLRLKGTFLPHTL